MLKMVKILKRVSFKEFFTVNEEIVKTSPMKSHGIHLPLMQYEGIRVNQ